jgi:hypothetical protein
MNAADMSGTARPRPGTLITDGVELHAFWSRLMGEGGFARRSIWMVFLDPRGRTHPDISPIDDLPATPDARFVAKLEMIVDSLIDDVHVGSVPLLLSRHGPVEMTESDRQWARALEPVRRRSGWPLHLATYECVRVFAPDDYLTRARSAP